MTELISKASVLAPFPKGLLIWNYLDHEHIVGTHYKHYSKIEVIAETKEWCLSRRRARPPFFPLSSEALAFLYFHNENVMRSFHTGPFGLLLRQEFEFEEVTSQETRVTVTSRLTVNDKFKFLQPLFKKIMLKWFWAVWDEDMEMRERRLKVWRLGFKDFVGLDYINDKSKLAPIEENLNRAYPVTTLVPKVTSINKGGIDRPFSQSVEVGYGLPDL